MKKSTDHEKSHDALKDILRKRIHNGIWITFKIIIMFIIIMVVISRIVPHSHDGWWNGEYETIDNDWVLTRGSGETETVSLPDYVSSKAGEKLTLTGHMPAHVADGSSMLFYCMKQDVVIYIDGQRAGTYMGSSSDLPMKWYRLVCSSSDSGKEIKILTISDDDGYAGCFNRIYIGEFSTIIYHLTMQNIIPLAAGFINLIIGISLLIYNLFFMRNAKTRKFMYMSIFSVNSGAWLVMECRVNQTFLSNLEYAQDFYFVGIMLAMIPLLFYYDEAVNGGHRKMMTTVITVSILVLYAFLLNGLADSKNYTNMHMFMYIYVLITGVYLIILYFLQLKDSAEQNGEPKEQKIDLYGVLILEIGVLADFITFCYQREVSTCIGSSAAIACLAISGLVRFEQYRTRTNIDEADALKQNRDHTRFLADMSHAIRTPVNAVLGMDNLILRESDDNVISGYATDIKSAGDSLLSSIGDILDLSDIESGKIELKNEEYSVSALISDCYNLIDMRAQDKGLKLNMECDPEVPSVLIGDEKRIRQVTINLLTNAVKYSSKGTVTMAVSGLPSDNDGSVILEIEVIDTGIGIGKDQQEKMFSPYARLDESKNRGIEGTGLGLALTKRLVDIMNGSISVESIYGSGSRFDVRIEQKVSESAAPVGESCRPEDMHTNISTETVKWFSAPDAKILVVDDVPMNLKVMKGLLGETGISIDTALGGAECIELVSKRKYDMIFMDDMMPEMSGIETFEIMKKDVLGKNKDTPVIMLTANAVMGAKEEYLEKGFAGYLSKPISEQELYEIMLRSLPDELVLSDDMPDTYADNENQDAQISESEETDKETDKKTDKEIDKETDKDGEIIRRLSSYINTTDGIKYCMNKRSLYIELLHDYVSSDRRGMIIDTFGKKDWEDYRISVHSLKSTSKMIGADDVSEKARKLEYAARDGDIDYISDNNDDLLKDYDRLVDEIKSVIE